MVIENKYTITSMTEFFKMLILLKKYLMLKRIENLQLKAWY